MAEIPRGADLFVLNLECCISERVERFPDPGKPFFFRAPPAAAGTLADLGVDCVTLANNHALDYGEQALLDTLGHLDQAGIPWGRRRPRRGHRAGVARPGRRRGAPAGMATRGSPRRRTPS